MDRTPVTSSSIRALAYDRASRTLEIEYRSGAVYQYQRVPKSEFNALMMALSRGRYLNLHIRSRYPCRRV